MSKVRDSRESGSGYYYSIPKQSRVCRDSTERTGVLQTRISHHSYMTSIPPSYTAPTLHPRGGVQHTHGSWAELLPIFMIRPHTLGPRAPPQRHCTIWQRETPHVGHVSAGQIKVSKYGRSMELPSLMY